MFRPFAHIQHAYAHTRSSCRWVPVAIVYFVAIRLILCLFQLRNQTHSVYLSIYSSAAVLRHALHAITAECE